jgi:hypothetical protein
LLADEPAQQLEAPAVHIERLGKILNRLNFFRAAGVTWSELRHSDFLAFLLSPGESHRLKDKFLKSFLQQVAMEHPSAPNIPSSDELSSWTLDDSAVGREKDHIDIRITNTRLGLAVIVENKTGTQEHGDQLKRYWEAILKSRRTPRVIGLFLSPSRAVPTHQAFLPISYRTVYRALENVRAVPEMSDSREVAMILRHYSQLIEGEFMDQSHASKIAWEIHRDYPKAISFLSNNPPAQQIKNEVKIQISETEGCSFEHDRPADEIFFMLPEWRKDPLLIQGQLAHSAAWLFWFDGFDDRLRLWLGADPGNAAAVTKLKAIAESNHFFHKADIGLDRGGWPTIWSREFLSSSDLLELNRERCSQNYAKDGRASEIGGCQHLEKFS